MNYTLFTDDVRWTGVMISIKNINENKSTLKKIVLLNKLYIVFLFLFISIQNIGQSIPLTIEINFIASKDNDEEREMHSKSV